MRQFARARKSGKTKPTAAVNQVDETVIRDRINRSMRRRMSDELVGLIRRACMLGHAETAKGLWVVLHDLTLREAKQQFPHGRYLENGLLDALALEIAAAAKEK
jgi:hypothetical protein